jgi:hypothetical protein
MKTFSTTWVATRFSLGLLAVSALVLVAGCNNPPNSDFEETVSFNSTPANAKLSIDGVDIGTTPKQAVLGKDAATHIVISKPGFAPADIYVHIQGSHLAPNPVDVVLRCDLLPDKPGPDRAAELATALDNLKKYVAIGNIAPEDAPEAERQIREFYK